MAKYSTRLLTLVLLAATPLAFPSGPLLGQEPLVTDRPDFTESAAAVVPGRVQVEAGATFESLDGIDAWSVGELLARIGVISGVELRVGVPSWIDVDGLEGFDDAFLGGKVEIPASDTWGTAVLFGTTVPVGDEEVAAAEWQPEVVLALERDLSERVGVGFNGGWGRPVVGEERVDELFGSAAVGFDLGDGWGAFAETFGFVTDGDGRAFVNGGITRLIGLDLQLDARIGTGVGGASDEWFAGVGLSQRW